MIIPIKDIKTSTVGKSMNLDVPHVIRKRHKGFKTERQHVAHPEGLGSDSTQLSCGKEATVGV
ncbi:MAG: hypothetical protein V7L05_27555 [Nostoc sp.]|uniref:hypothetical protein n=1 Tax=Nostoc sp. TaxID=1180 RepID=UPI002FF83F6B